MHARSSSSPATPESSVAESLALVRQALESLRYGAIALTVHEGRVVQIDITEKRRLAPR